MTLLVGGSVLLIAGSALALLFGWITAEETLIWTSIVASAVAAVLLALAYYRSKQEASTTGSEEPSSEPVEASSSEETSAAARRSEGEGGDAEAGTTPDAEGRPAPIRPRRMRASRPETPAPTGRQNNGGEVVAIPERRRYHRPECRYARSKGAERIARTTARRRGYEACNICKP